MILETSLFLKDQSILCMPSSNSSIVFTKSYLYTSCIYHSRRCPRMECLQHNPPAMNFIRYTKYIPSEYIVYHLGIFKHIIHYMRTHTYVHMYACIHETQTQTQTHTHTCMHARTCTYMCMWTHTHTDTYTHTRVGQYYNIIMKLCTV